MINFGLYWSTLVSIGWFHHNLILWRARTARYSLSETWCRNSVFLFPIWKILYFSMSQHPVELQNTIAQIFGLFNDQIWPPVTQGRSKSMLAIAIQNHTFPYIYETLWFWTPVNILIHSFQSFSISYDPICSILIQLCNRNVQ